MRPWQRIIQPPFPPPPHLHHTRQHAVPCRTPRIYRGPWPRARAPQRSKIRSTKLQIRGINIEVRVAGLVSDEREDVGAAVPAAEGGEGEVRLHGREGGVVRVECCVGCAVEGCGDGAAEQDGKDAVGGGVVLVFVEGEEDQRVFTKVIIGEEGRQERARPGAGDADGGVVAVVGHVRRHKGPLWKSLDSEIVREAGEVLEEGAARGVAGYGVEEDEGVVLADVGVRVRELVGVVEPFEAGVWEGLHVLGPCDAFGVEQISDRGNVGGDGDEVVVVKAEVVARGGC